MDSPAMPKPPRYPNIFLPNDSSIWWARLVVPAAVREIIGKRQFSQSTQQTDPAEAYRVSRPWVEEWKRQIDNARAARGNPVTEQIERLANDWRQARAKGDDEQAFALACDVIDYLFETLGGLNGTQAAAAMAAAKGRVALAVQRLPEADRTAVQTAYEQASGLIQPAKATKFLRHLDDYRSSAFVRAMKPSYRDLALNEVTEFGSWTDQPIETLRLRHAQKFVDCKLHPTDGSKPLKPTSLMHKMISCRAYWKWLQSQELAPADVHPFTGLSFKDARNPAQRAADRRLAWKPEQIVKLWTAAKDAGDFDLYAAIKIAAYTGLRRSGVGGLNVKAVYHDLEIPGRRVSGIFTDDETGIRCFHVEEKTEDGFRNVPIHPELTDLIDKLIKEAAADGFLIKSAGWDKHRTLRGDDLGDRFSKLKTAIFGDAASQLDFHSIRHTVQGMLEDAGAGSKVRKNILGHKVADITEGRYGRIRPLDERLAAIEKLKYPT